MYSVAFGSDLDKLEMRNVLFFCILESCNFGSYSIVISDSIADSSICVTKFTTEFNNNVRNVFYF